MTSADAAAPPTADAAPARDALRAHLFLHCMLPLTDVVVRHTPTLARVIGAWTALYPRAGHTQWRAPSLGLCVGARFAHGRVHAAAEAVDADAPALRFTDAAQVCGLFTGAPPAAVALQLARAPLTFAPIVGCLTQLRILAEPDRITTSRQRALYVDAALCLIALGLSQMARAGHRGAAGLVRHSPHRVFQWSVGGSELGAYWRVARGQTRAGRGRYDREPWFVHVRFASVDAAFRTLTARGGQMERLRAGDVETTGSPEYARQVTALVWELDDLLLAR